jgi:SAM-dependent methyltransferase
VEDLLSPRLSAAEAEVIAGLLRLGPRDRVLDAGCGHGRHARLLAGRVAALVGLDRSGEYLRRAARPGDPTPSVPPRYLRADLRALPFRRGAFDAAYSWYASLFMFDDRTNAACLAGLGAAVRRGGRLLVHHANPLRLAREPQETSSRDLPGGGRVEEESLFDPALGVDRCRRRLVRPDGTALEGTAQLRYYTPSEWGPLARSAGLRVVELTNTPDAGRERGRAPGPDAPDLVVLLEKP